MPPNLSRVVDKMRTLKRRHFVIWQFQLVVSGAESVQNLCFHNVHNVPIETARVFSRFQFSAQSGRAVVASRGTIAAFVPVICPRLDQHLLAVYLHDGNYYCVALIRVVEFRQVFPNVFPPWEYGCDLISVLPHKNYSVHLLLSLVFLQCLCVMQNSNYV